MSAQPTNQIICVVKLIVLIPTGSLFGGTQMNQQAGSSLFGTSSTPAPAGGSLFGNSAPAAGGSLFGGQQSGAGGGSLFGKSNAAPTTSFFGNTQQQQQTGSSLFGNTGQQQQQTGSLFGNAPAPNTGGSLFGSAGGFQSNQQQNSMVPYGQQQQQFSAQNLNVAPPVPYAGGATSQMVTHVALAQKAWKTVDGPEPPKGGGLKSRATPTSRQSAADTSAVSSGSGFPLDTVRIRPRGYGRGYGSLVSVQSQAMTGKDRVSRLADSNSGSAVPTSARQVLSPGVFDLNKRLSINKARRATPATKDNYAPDGDEHGTTPMRAGSSDAALMSAAKDSTTKQLFIGRSPVSQPSDSPAPAVSQAQTNMGSSSNRKSSVGPKRRVNFAVDDDNYAGDNDNDADAEEEQVPSSSPARGGEEAQNKSTAMSDKCPTMSQEYVKRGYKVCLCE
jgi:hypothetical protein